MCDTIFVGKKILGDRTILAKNSDRHPNEPQAMLYFPPAEPKEEYVKTTYMKVNQVNYTNGILLSKPSWIWGGEMGINDRGVAIGNEAVFTKEAIEENRLLGMDMLRLALERSLSAQEAMRMITEFLEEYGQGGNGAYYGELNYHNSFLVADIDEGWLLETAGKYWAAKRIVGMCTISNALTIDNDFDLIHPEAVKHAVEKKWCKSEDDFEFAKAYSNKLYTYFSGANKRKERTEEFIRDESPEINPETVMKLLKDHQYDKDIKKGSMKNVCMHGGGIISNQTTASMICEIGKKTTIWATGTSAPCISTYKPIWFTDTETTLPYSKEPEGMAYWRLWEEFHRKFLFKRKETKDYLRKTMEEFQDDLLQKAEEAKDNQEKCAELTRFTFTESAKLAKRLGDKIDKEKNAMVSPIFRVYWGIQNARMKSEKKSYTVRF
ncbi:MAG: C69 family dipeptidase [Kosmotogaceae bacterium]